MTTIPPDLLPPLTHVPRRWQRHLKTHSGEIKMYVGGGAATFAMQIAELGVPVGSSAEGAQSHKHASAGALYPCLPPPTLTHIH